MSKAIIVPYVIDQHAPSRPLSELYDIPDDPHYIHMEEERQTKLKAVYLDVFGLEVDSVCIRESGESGYGDLSVWSNDDEDCFLYVTFIK